MVHYESLGENLEAIDEVGKLRTVSEPMNKDTELMPLVRCQFRGLPESERMAWLFENPTDSRGRSYDMPVAVACVGPSREVYRLNLGCETDAELVEKWENALDNPIDPTAVSSSPVQDVVLTRDDLEGEGKGIDKLPIPISTPGFDPAPYFTSGYTVTKDPETGVVNMGTYRGQYKSSNTMGLWWASTQDIRTHWEKAKDRGEPLEAAMVIGAPPHVSMVSVSKVPRKDSEFAVCGGLIDEPLEVVDCETVDLQVPASAEIILEGEFTFEKYPEGPFGEFTGYMGATTEAPNFNVNCITHRENPIYQAFFSQMPPSESSLIRKVGYEQNILRHIRSTSISNVQDVVLHQESGSRNFLVIQLDKESNVEPWQAMYAVMGFSGSQGRITVAVDDDIDPEDIRSVLWAMSFRVQPEDDVRTADYRTFPLDPVSAPFDDEEVDRRFPTRTGESALLIDATRPWGYPPTSLPRKEFMEAAVENWEDLGLPDLDMVDPWYGEELGAWDDDLQQMADDAVDGKYYQHDAERDLDDSGF